MFPQISFILPVDGLSAWISLAVFGAYHGLNPGMGWLFALSLGLQQRSERAIWQSLPPIVVGHAASLVVVAAIVLAGMQFASTTLLQWITALLLLGFGGYKILNYYRHPRWVGMKVNRRDLTWWSFLMATAHGAGLMIVPGLLGIATLCGMPDAQMSLGVGMVSAVVVHTLSMLLVMTVIAWIVYKRLGLSVLRKNWVNFDLIWAVALLIVGGVALVHVAVG
jgi:hypothetical protein